MKNSLCKYSPCILLTLLVINICIKMNSPLYPKRVVRKMKSIQQNIQDVEWKISIPVLEKHKRFTLFTKEIYDRSKPDGRWSKPSMIIMAEKGSFPWIENLLCSISEYSRYTFVSVFTTDRETTLQVATRFPMLSMCELNFDELLENSSGIFDNEVRRRLFDIVRLRIGAILARKQMDVLIASPRQIWTADLFKRPLYTDHKDRKRIRHAYGIAVQKMEPDDEEGVGSAIDLQSFFVLGGAAPEGASIFEHSAEVVSRRFVSADAALTYMCDSSKAYLCRSIPPQRMSSVSFIKDRKLALPDILHFPMKTTKQKLQQEGLWLVSSDEMCSSDQLLDLQSTSANHGFSWQGNEFHRKFEQKRVRFHLLHRNGLRSLLEESDISSL